MEKFVLSQMKDEDFSKAVNEIYLLTDYNKKQYPDYYKWFFSKNIPRIINGTGDVIFYLDETEIVGVSILKNENEKKICTFMINPKYRKKGNSKILLKDSFEYLKTDKPVITIPEFRLNEFSSIIKAYNWEETSVIDNYLSKEIEFNNPKKLIRK